MRKFGTLGVEIQPDRTITTSEDGLMEGTVTFEADTANEGAFPRIGDQHPDNWRLVLWRHSITRMRAEKSRMVAEYIGITHDPTTPVVTFPGGNGQEPIERHPKFAELAGNVAAPVNGAKFDPVTWEFLGFTDPDYPEFYGLTNYITPNILVYRTYYSFRAPSQGNVLEVRGSIPGVRKPQNVKDWLLLGIPIRQIGPLYQITEQYLGSSEAGWPREVYY